ncbi:MAG TPA: phosphatidate cytidylyltransferase [Pirellulaceae bacterium]|nr:phosphatidate cytidylyltransferase [Pirellulaceae bacterium]
MSSQEALQSPIYLSYVAIVAGILLLAGIALAVLQWGAGRDVSHAATSFRAWLIMVPGVALVQFLGREATIVSVVALAICGFREFARATGLSQNRLMTAVPIAGMVCAGALAWADGAVPSLSQSWYEWFLALPAFVTAAILLSPIFRNQVAGQLRQIALAVLGFVYIGWMFGHLAFLANASNAYGYLCFVLVAVTLNDVAAYACGRLFGRRPLRSNISPKKTWEGALGGAAVSLLLPWLLWFSFPHFGVWELILTGLIVGIGGQLGDLSISVMKRDVGVKDMGSSIPGHGGILDRIDSLIYVAPLFVHMTRTFHQQ